MGEKTRTQPVNQSITHPAYLMPRDACASENHNM